MKPLTILALDDEDRLIDELEEYLGSQGHNVITADRPSSAFSKIEKSEIDIAIVDIKLPEYDGLEFIRRLRKLKPDIEIMVMSGHGDMDSVIEAFRMGAFDYLRKPFTILELQMAIGRTKKYIDAQRESHKYEDLCRSLNLELAGNGKIIGNSIAMEKVRESIALAARNSNSPVVITGESGTGKELVARNIHALSEQSSGRFLAVNCAAIPREMFETEFFGHEKGAFTDARAARSGLFRSARGGTLFLDEVGEIPLDLQSKLLRAIEEGTVRPVGADKDQKTDVRIVCATNKDLALAVKDGTFRSDLYYRIAVIEIKVPPLREHPEDIPLLAEAFLKRFSRYKESDKLYLSPDSLKKITVYPFPGNVRELRNLIERGVIIGKNPVKIELAYHDDNKADFDDDGDSGRRGFEAGLNLDEIEKTAVYEALKISGNIRSRAAELLGITRQSLDRRMQKYNIQNS